MADDERDYGLTEAQQVVKAKYPAIQKKYECEFFPAGFPAGGRRRELRGKSGLKENRCPGIRLGGPKRALTLPAFMANEIQTVKRSLPPFNSFYFVFH